MTDTFKMTDKHYYLDWIKNPYSSLEEFAKHWGLSLERAKELTKPELSRELCDDVVEVKENGDWTQICARCLKKVRYDKERLDEDSGSGICGVQGCENEADHFYTFKQE